MAKVSSRHFRSATQLVIPVLFMVSAQLAWGFEAIADENVESCVGRVCRIEGVLADIHTLKNKDTVLDFGHPAPHQTFTAVIAADAASQFQFVQGYKGQRVRVTGLIKMRTGQLFTALDHPSQLASLE